VRGVTLGRVRFVDLARAVVANARRGVFPLSIGAADREARLVTMRIDPSSRVVEMSEPWTHHHPRTA
jgi:hypothetical protein